MQLMTPYTEHNYPHTHQVLVTRQFTNKPTRELVNQSTCSDIHSKCYSYGKWD